MSRDRPRRGARAKLPSSIRLPSSMRKEGRELALRQRPIKPSELDRNVVEPAGPEATIEMPQSRNDHASNRDLDVGPRLVEHEEVELHAPHDTQARFHLGTGIVETAELGIRTR